jgi:hypothetical protein
MVVQLTKHATNMTDNMTDDGHQPDDQDEINEQELKHGENVPRHEHFPNHEVMSEPSSIQHGI